MFGGGVVGISLSGVDCDLEDHRGQRAGCLRADQPCELEI